MFENSVKWGKGNNKDKVFEDNQRLGKSIDAHYDSRSGIWYKNGLRLYHTGGIVGDKGSPLIERLHRMLNLGADERLSVLKLGELVVRDNPLANLSHLRMPDLSGIVPRQSSLPAAPSLSFEKLIHIEKVEKDVDIDRIIDRAIHTLDRRFKAQGFVMP